MCLLLLNRKKIIDGLQKNTKNCNIWRKFRDILDGINFHLFYIQIKSFPSGIAHDARTQIKETVHLKTNM